MAEIRLSKLTKQFSIGLQRLVDFLNEKGANVEMNPNAKVSDVYLPEIEAKFGEDLKLKKDSEKVTIKLKEMIELGGKKKPNQEEEEAPEKEIIIKSNVLETEAPKAQPKPAQEEAKAQPEAIAVEEDIKPAAVQAAAQTTPEVPAKAEAAPVDSHKPQGAAEGGLKVIDKIDLSQFEKKKKSEVKEEAPAVKPSAEQVSAPTPAEEPAHPAKTEPAQRTESPAKEAEQPAEKPVQKPVQEAKPEVRERTEPREIKVEVERLAGPKVVDKIDLSQFDRKKKKKKKRERIDKPGIQKVDVTKVEADNKSAKKDKNGKPAAGPGQRPQRPGAQIL